MTTVSGIIRDTQGNALPGLDVTIRYKRPLVGYNGGAAVQNSRAFTTDGDGLLTMPDLVPGHYDFFVSIQANAASSGTLLQNGTLVVLTEGPMTLEAALDSTIGEITPTILQQAIDARDAAEGFRDEAEAAADSINQQTVDTVAGISADVTTVAGISADVTAVAGDEADIGIVATDIADVSTVAGISADVTTVSGISADVTTVAADGTDIGVVAGISADVTAVAADVTDIGIVATDITDVSTVAGISADVTAVAGDEADIGIVATDIADVSTVAGIAANVTTVAGASANVTTVAGISADVTTAAANVTDITNFSDVYIGPSATDPTLRNDGSALQEGDLYFNTADDVVNVYEGTIWVAAFASLSGALLATSNLSDLTDASVALTNLGVTATAAELNTLDGVTATAAELNTLDGVTATAAELNFVDGVTSNIQTQINARLKSDDKATQAEAEAGTDNSVYMTPLRTAEAIDVLSPAPPELASQAQAEDGTDNETLMTPLRTAQAIEELSPATPELTEAQATDDTSTVFGAVSGERLKQQTNEAFNVSGSAPKYACRAWVNFKGTGTVAIRASGNVSSITDNRTADYTINFATEFEDANYAVTGVCGTGDSSFANSITSIRLQDFITVSAVRIRTTSDATIDFADVHVAVFR